MAAVSVPSEIIEKERKKLLDLLQQDPDSILDALNSRRLISEEEYEALEDIADPLKKSRKLLILVQKKGEVSCLDFLKCLFSTFPESATTWNLRHEFLKHENIEAPQYMGVSKKLEDAFSSGEKQPETPESTVYRGKGKGHLDLDTPEAFSDKTSYRETVLSSRENEKESNTPKVTLPHSVDAAKYEVPAPTEYLRDGQRYAEPDGSLYLGKEECLEPVGYSEHAETILGEEDYNDPEDIVYDGEEDFVNSQTTDFSEKEESCEDEETGMSLEEEEEKKRKKVFNDLLSYLNMDRNRKLLPDFVKQFSLDRGHGWTPESPGDLAWNFLMKVQALDMTARDSILRHKVLDKDSEGELLTGIGNLEIRDTQTINPFDVLCASLLCSDSSLQREVMSNMYQCQFALPLLLPDAENNKSIFMLRAMKDIVKKQPTQSAGGPTMVTDQFLTLVKVPVISFVRLGYCSFSKSRILNTLLSSAQMKPHKIFLHRDLSAPVLPRQISDGLVEIMWCFPDCDGLKENHSVFQKAFVVANLRGDVQSFWTQFGFLMEVSSAVFFFTDCLGEKEWDLLMFLGEAAIQRCYFVLSPQAKESEEAQIFQRVLKLKPSQLLFWEEEEAGERGKSMGCLRATLQEVISSSLTYVSMEDMASLARELGIQVDQDFENFQGIQVSPSESLSETAENEGQQRCHHPESSSETHAKMPVREAGARSEVSQNLQDFHPTPVFCPLPTRTGGDFNHVSLKAPQAMGPHFCSEQRSKWFHPSHFQNTRTHSQGKSFGIQYFQPQRFYSHERFMKLSRTAQGHHMIGTFERPPRPFPWCVQVLPRPQKKGALERPRAVVSQVGQFCSLGSQLAGAVRKPQPRQACTQGTQPTGTTGKLMRKAPNIKDPHSPAFQAADIIQKPVRPAPWQGAQLKTEGGPLNPAFQMGVHPMSNSKCLPRSQLKSNQSKLSQVEHFQPKPSQPITSQPQHPLAQRSPSKPAQPKPYQPQPSQCKPSQSKPTQPKSSQTNLSQAKAYHPRAGPRRVRKH
ncbi:caspase recruitment domain-containing protein 6 isoform X2 [Manis pentadactyla]|uniref:caspase recruitment domain-containing protein 6 isoform X2 n=1 Tax=Manis pentadactyla TaxID=143292 RepID=UPI00255C5D7E|nr:caspase recruitment domain-containing protein 6 isoform X2 [Manis pentadactyla]